MFSRVSIVKESAGKIGKPLSRPKPAHEYFSAEETPESGLSSLAYSLAGINLFAPGENGGSNFVSRCARVPWPMQAKLQIGAVDDPLEAEADQTADRVMRIADPPAAPLRMTSTAGQLQRKCSCGGSGSSGGECKECQEKREEKQLQRKASASAPVNAVPDAVGNVLRSPGQPLDTATRNYFEPRLAWDLSNVRVHTDARAADSARRVNALAYTVGNNVVFGSGQYSPRTDSGKRLIAHELAHTVQQASGSHLRLQRAVSKDIAKIEKLLSRSLFDWAITDSDAHQVLVLLKALPAADLKDTVAEMEKGGYIGRLFDNVSDEDQANETAILESINDVRVHKGGKNQKDTVGSCDQSQRNEIDTRVSKTQEWAAKAKDRVKEFAADPAKHADTLTMLDRQFFHSKKNGQLSEVDQKTNANQIADNFQLAEKQINPKQNECASPFDSECAALALAYWREGKRIVLCKSYFGSPFETQVYNLLHEFMHEYAHVNDRGYGDERVFEYLSPKDAINNADSYALFAVDVNAHTTTSREQRPAHSEDNISDCGPQKEEVRRSFAFASRMIINALNALGDSNSTGVFEQTHFKTKDRNKLQRFIERCQKIDKKFREMNFQCEKKCKGNTPGYWRTWGSTVHLVLHGSA